MIIAESSNINSHNRTYLTVEQESEGYICTREVVTIHYCQDMREVKEFVGPNDQEIHQQIKLLKEDLV